jgi:4-aminobutyrate aminotransferase-like enzyme/Ser/Thr protein kinase RdoA (MazF antagonist)
MAWRLLCNRWLERWTSTIACRLLTGDRYVLKISSPDTDRDQLDLQAKVMDHLAQKALPFATPRILPDQEQKLFVEGEGHRLRLQSWVPGRMLEEVNPKTPALLRDWGRTCGHLSQALKDFDHPAAHRFYAWDPVQTLFSRQHLPLMSAEQQEIANFFWDRFEKQSQPLIGSLRKSVNYQDAHGHNLLLSDSRNAPQIVGLIDFGDVGYGPTLNELAIACAYAGMNMPDPVRAMSEVVAGYHEVFPLEQMEVSLLFSLITARLLITVAQAAHNQQAEPDNAYLQVSAAPAWELLGKLKEVHPALIGGHFRKACGWDAAPLRQKLIKWVGEQREAFVPPIPLEGKRIARLDLAVDSLELGNNAHFLSIEAFQRKVQEIMEEKQAEIGIGGYGEVRPFYTTDAYQVMGNDGPQWRSVHLGWDFWAEAGTPVRAPLRGELVGFADNAAERDYGPTIILSHDMGLGKGLGFFSLYGHLSRKSLEGLEVGQVIEKGEAFAELGPAPENGNWPPHLHFQLMHSLLGNTHDFPGVAFPHEKAVWLDLCPDPQLFFPDLLPPLSSPRLSTERILEKRQRYLGKNLSLSYHKPLHMVRGFGSYLYADDARRYLDTVNNVAHVGHEHPRVVQAGQRQMALLNTNTRYLHHQIVQYAEELLATFPDPLSVVYFVNSGSEANELALRMAKTTTCRQDVIALQVGYHGNTNACVEVSSYKFDGKGGKGAPPHTHILPMPDVFRGEFRGKGAGAAYQQQALNQIEQWLQKGVRPAAFLAENILSCGGQIVLPKGYLNAVYQAIRKAGGLCIADEVQTGLGRVGAAFWAFELQGVVPDVVTLGKPLGNGHPLGAVVTTQEVAEAFNNGMEYFNTFGGNPVSCAIGREVLRVVQEEGLRENARELGTYLKEALRGLQERFPLIGEVRGEGLFLGIELVREKNSKLLPAAAEASYLAQRMRERGILMSTDGPDHNVIKIKPPMCFSKPQADFLLEQLAWVFQEDFLANPAG